MKTLLIAALVVFGGAAYAGWQHGFYSCYIEIYLLGGLALTYLLSIIAGKICRKVFGSKDEED